MGKGYGQTLCIAPFTEKEVQIALKHIKRYSPSLIRKIKIKTTATTTEARTPRAHDAQQEKSPLAATRESP